MQINRVSLLCVGAVDSDVYPVLPQNPMSVGFGVLLISGAINATVKFTFDPVNNAAQIAAARWFDHPFVAGVVANTAGNIAEPVSGIKLSNGGSGTAELIINQYVGQ